MKEYIPLIRAESVQVSAGTMTITIPQSPALVPGNKYDIGLFTAVTVTTTGNAIEIVTDAEGAEAVPVLNWLGSNARPKMVTARQVLRVLYLDDPGHFLLLDIRG